jgi:ribosomal protein S26
VPTPRERAVKVVTTWQQTLVDPLPTADLERLAALISAAIDAQVADWQATLPGPRQDLAAAALTSPVVAHEPGKNYAQPNGQHLIDLVSVAVAAPRPAAAAEVMHPTCLHQSTRWDKENRYLECQGCGKQFPKGRCIRCGRSAVNEESFSCGEHCR